MEGDMISRRALLDDIRDGLKGFPPFTDDAEKVGWVMRRIEGAPAAGQEPDRCREA